MSNLNFPKVFVASAANKFTPTKLATALAVGELTLLSVDQQQVVLGAAGATPNPAVVRLLQHAQNVGDSNYGAVRSKNIKSEQVRQWFGKAARVATQQISYIGYDEIDGTKDIVANCGQELIIPISIYEKKLARWYAPVGFNRRLVIDTGCCPDCGSPCTAADKTYIATRIAALINTGDQREGDYIVGNEFGAYLTATVVTNGGAGDALRVGVKLVSKALDTEVLNNCDPQYWFEFQTLYFTVGKTYNGFCDGTKLPVTTTQQADPGTGWAAGLAALEAESQGFDRVRDHIDAFPYSKKNGYKIFAVAGTKYDYFHLVFDWTHRVNTGTTSFITEPYETIVAFPTGQGDVYETAINTWLAGKFPAVNLVP